MPPYRVGTAERHFPETGPGVDPKIKAMTAMMGNITIPIDREILSKAVFKSQRTSANVAQADVDSGEGDSSEEDGDTGPSMIDRVQWFSHWHDLDRPQLQKRLHFWCEWALRFPNLVPADELEGRASPSWLQRMRLTGHPLSSASLITAIHANATGGMAQTLKDIKHLMPAMGPVAAAYRCAKSRRRMTDTLVAVARDSHMIVKQEEPIAVLLSLCTHDGLYRFSSQREAPATAVSALTVHDRGVLGDQGRTSES